MEFGDLPSIWGNSPEEENDSRRAFTQTQKKEILFQQDSKCARCHKKLDPRATQFDHKKPWASGGRTITINGRALCSSCHDIVTHQDRLKKVDKGKKEQKNNNFGLGDFRLPEFKAPKISYFLS